MVINRFLTQLVDGKKILAVEETIVPSTPKAEHPGNHLFVNCLYQHDILQMDPEALLLLARKDMILVLRTLVIHSMLLDVTSVCINFLAKSETEEYLHRIYRYSVLTSHLPHDEKQINGSYFEINTYCLQSSHHDGITKLLAEETQKV